MIDRTVFCSLQLRRIFSMSRGPIPFTCARNDGDWSITSSVFSLNTSTIRSAYCGPIPFTSPEPRYFSIPSAVCGGVVLISSALNCRPCVRSVTHVAGRGHVLAGDDLLRVPDDGDQVAVSARLHAQHAVAVIEVVERDPLDHAAQLFRHDRTILTSR